MTPVGAYRLSDRLTSSRAGPLEGDFQVPGDKSISHRALILGGMAQGRTSINGLLESADVLRTARALQLLSCEVRRECASSWSISGGKWKGGRQLNCGNSGTTFRLLLGACAAMGIAAHLDGDESLRSRPMMRVIEPLTQMGAQIKGKSLPLSISPARLNGIDYPLQIPSAQVKSAILLAGLGTRDPVRVEERARSRDHTEIMLKHFGCDVRRDGDWIELGDKGKLEAAQIQVPGDPSSAAFVAVAAALVPGSRLFLRNIGLNPLRTGWLKILGQMGANVTTLNEHEQCGELVGDILITGSGRPNLEPVRVPSSLAPSTIDEYPILAIAAATAPGVSVFEGLSELRVKESNRLSAIVGGLNACGVKAHLDDDNLIIHGGSEIEGGAEIATYGDHRIAMSFLVLGCASKHPIQIDRAEMIDTSFPEFDELMRQVGAHVVAG